MWQVIKSSPLAVLAAVLVHLLLVVVLLVNIDWPTDEADSGEQEEMEVIEARAVNEREFEAREQRLREAEEKKRQAEQERRRQAELKKQREAEAKERREEAARKAQEAEEKKRKEAEAKRQAELKKQREAEEARRRQEEAARKQREADEQKRREEAARKAREAEEQKRREQELQAELEAEAEAQARREWLARHGDEINRYKSRIKDSITRHWRIPVTASSGMRCEIVVRLLPGGEVASVRITQGSGDAAFDRSVEDAVFSAAPLPVPSVDSGLFDEFREIEFVFAPEDKR